MCLLMKRNQKKLIAQEDIPCVKVLIKEYDTDDSILVSPYKRHPYVFGEMVEAEIGEPENYLGPNDSLKIEEGIHSFANKIDAVRETSFWFDSFYVLCHAIIPKGAEYYEGIFGGDPSYVSNQLIVKDRVAGPVWINVYV